MSKSISDILMKSKDSRLAQAHRNVKEHWVNNQVNIIFDQINKEWINIILKINNWAETKDPELFDISNEIIEARDDRSPKRFDAGIRKLKKAFESRQELIPLFFKERKENELPLL